MAEPRGPEGNNEEFDEQPQEAVEAEG